MDHVAIMKKSWKLLPKILSGEKTFNSRWNLNNSTPWDKIKKGDIVYFKNSGEFVTVKAEVKEVKQFENLNSVKVRQILTKFGQKDGIGISDLSKFYKMFKDKKYCILVFIKNPRKIKPFEIDKSGFGSMSAWISVVNINLIRT